MTELSVEEEADGSELSVEEGEESWLPLSMSSFNVFVTWFGLLSIFI